ncbi:MAG: MarR family winged helix-turn-helix transcriptional regulator [Hominenteromicrobium sp.]
MYTSKDMKRFNYLISETEAAYHEMTRKLGISDSAMIVLYTICDNGGACLLKEICRRSGIRKQTINSAIRKLEAEEIVFLESADAKSKKVCLTEKGHRLAACTAMRMIQAENEILASWPKAEVEQYLDLTERFLTAFREKMREM